MSLKELQQLKEAHRTHQRQEALQRPAAGETMADIAWTYNSMPRLFAGWQAGGYQPFQHAAVAA